MSATTSAMFEPTVQKTHAWLKELQEDLALQQRQGAYLALRAVLHALRDHLTLEEVAQLGAQLPMLIRGLYYEGWHPSDKPLRERNRDAFLVRVYHELHPGFNDPDVDLEQLVRAVFTLLARHVSSGEIDDVKAVLPKSLRTLWPA